MPPVVEEPRPSEGATIPAGDRGPVAYTMSRFPKARETFILTEILALRRRGVPIEIYPLLEEHETVRHPGVDELMPSVHYTPFVSGAILAANLATFLRRPWTYLRTVFEVFTGVLGSLNFFVGALGIFPKSVYLARRMERRGVGHLHAHFATHPALAALIVHRFTGIPFSFTAHGHDIHIELRMFDRKLAAAEFAVMISEYNIDFVCARFGDHLRPKFRLVHCGIDPEFFRPRDGAPDPDRPLELICVAAFMEVKGHVHLIEACRLLAERGVDFRLRLVGDGELRAAIELQVAEAGLGEKVIFEGPQPRDRVASMLRAADIGLLTSVLASRGDREGIPVCLMEAMASGLPVVASDLSGIPELVDATNGRLFPPGDAGAIATALEELAADPELRRRLGAAGREKVLAEFDLDRSADRMAELLTRSARGRQEDAET